MHSAPTVTARSEDRKGTVMLYARLRGVLSDEWSEGSPPASAVWLDRFIQHLPFAIGRTAGNDPSIGLTDDPASWWLFPNQSKISRKHVVIRWEGGRYLLKCYGTNGADVNGKHIESGEEVALPTRSTLRLGPLYAYFLLPHPHSHAPPAAPAAPKQKAKLSVPGGYAAVVAGVVAKHFSAFQHYFTLSDLARLALKDYPGQGLAEDLSSLKTTLTRILKNVDYEPVSTAAVPKAVVEAFAKVHTEGAGGKNLKWYVKLGPEELEAKKKKLAATAAAAAVAAGAAGGGGGGGGGGKDEMEGVE